jgi:hypothetical protein
MAKILLLLLLALHGLIHLLGAARCWGWARIPQLTGRSLWPMGWLPDWVQGMAWGLAASLLLLGAALLLADTRTWPWLAAVGIVLSQLLVLAYWPEAKWGTLANVLLLLPVAAGLGEARMERETEQYAYHLLHKHQEQALATVSAAELATLPPCVQHWLNAAGVTGHPRVRSAYLVQRGRMRLKPDASWMPYEARQLTTTSVPSVLWNARVQMLPGVQLLGRDYYTQAKGHMYIRLLGLLPVADARGPYIDQGSQLRYLAEMAFYPTEALQPYLRWEQLNDSTARVYMTQGTEECHADFIFNAQNELCRITGPRYYEEQGKWTKRLWQIDLEGVQQADGLRVPERATLSWQLPEGLFTWAEMTITQLQYNVDQKPLFVRSLPSLLGLYE